jgi:NAD(P) transhydrogenase subunit alpha
MPFNPTQYIEKSVTAIDNIMPSETHSVEVIRAVEVDPFITGLTVFMLAAFVGYYVVWRVTPALHSPLMAVTNAISSVIIVGALVVAGGEAFDVSKVLGFIAIVLASINIFGGFIVTYRMLDMFKKKTKK